MSTGLINFFNLSDRTSDKLLDMLYDMIPEKVEEFINIPILESLFDDNLSHDQLYWTFLEKIFPSIRIWSEYHEIIENDDETGETYDDSYYDFSVDDSGGFMMNSKLYFFIIDYLMEFNLDETTYYDNSEIMDKVPNILEEFKKIEEDEKNYCESFHNDIGDLEYTVFSTFTKIVYLSTQ